MKTSSYTLLLVIGLLFLSACGHRPYPTVLLTADTLCITAPDSAVRLLKQCEPQMLQSATAVRMYYQLLCIKAADKAYIPHNSDTLIQNVLQYYIKKNDRRHLPEAYYYAGRICRDLGDAPQALDYFQKAVEALPDKGEFDLKSRIYSQMGTLLLYQDVYDEAMIAYKKSLKYSYALKDSIGIIFSLRDIGLNFTAFHQKDSALHYYEKAYKLSVSIRNKHMQGIVLRAMADIYLQEEELALAKEMLQKSLNNATYINKPSIYTLSAKLHQQSGNLDSASFYYQHLINIGDIYNRQDAHKGLAYIAQKQGDTQTALFHIEKYQQCHDSIIDITNSENIKKMQSLYNYQLREKENHRLKTITMKQREWLLIIGYGFIISCFIFSIFTLHNRNKHLITQQRLRELEIIKEEQYRYSTKRIEENNKKIEELENQLRINNQNEKEKEVLLAQKAQIELINNKIEIKQHQKENAIKALKQSDIYKKFHQAKSFKELTESDWQQLQDAINNAYENFTNHLYALYPLSDIELHICLLVKSEVSVSKIALLTSRSKSAITSARKKLYEKIHNQKGTPDMFDQIIYELYLIAILTAQLPYRTAQFPHKKMQLLPKEKDRFAL